MQSRKSLISLFSGAGGLDLAFEASGAFSTQLFVESEPIFAQTLRINQLANSLGKGPIIENDISLLDPIETWTNATSAREAPWGIIGGPPCESFSSIGKQAGRLDRRGKLIFNFADWVTRLPVRAFMMENVPGLLSIEGGLLFRELMERFEKANFDVSYSILRASDYGAPTMRRRLFIVGVRGLPKFVFPSPSHGDPRKQLSAPLITPWVRSSIALSGLPDPAAVQPGEPQGHVLIKHTAEVTKRFNALKPGAVDRVRKRNRLDPTLPAPGLYAGNMKGIRFHIHPTEPRELTNREAARIQGFPDSYLFNGSRVAVGKQIANAVPIALGQAMALALQAQYFPYNGKPALPTYSMPPEVPR